MGICYIVGASGPVMPIQRGPDDFVIAADAGYLALRELNIKPDLVVGDFDSLGSPPEGETVVRHPVMKDDTDMMLAVKLALEKGYKELHIFGGMGGRTDHTLANLQALAYIANRGACAYLFGDGEIATCIKNGALRFPKESAGIVSVFAMGGQARGVYESGLLYSLHDALITPDVPVGVSNEFTGQPSQISVRDGMLLVIWTKAGLMPERLT